MSLPVLTICFNNHEFVANTVAQLRALEVDDITVIDNASNWDETRACLDALEAQGCRVIRNRENLGHLCWTRPEVFDGLPDKFCVTDPDLQFNPRLPPDFMDVMARLADRFQAGKVGFALELSDSALMFQDPDYHLGQSIAAWEAKFWTQRIDDEALELYLAEVDTTFHVFNKRGVPQRQLRVAGDYTARHLPWYRTNALIPPGRMTEIYRHATRVSTIARLHMRQHAAANAPATIPPSTEVPPMTTMKQTPAHSTVNTDLMGMIPEGARRVVEVGCMHGAMAQAWRAGHPQGHYTGIDIDAGYAEVASQYCDRALAGDIETLPEATFDSLFPSDCWIFGDCLEHLRDPWRIVKRIRAAIDADGCLLACIPNAQHWSVQMRLATGLFRYEDSGLLDRTHVRWFTRVTMQEMFIQAGWRVEHAFSRRLPQPAPPALVAGIRAVAEAAGADGEQAVQDAEAFQFLFRLRPA